MSIESAVENKRKPGRPPKLESRVERETTDTVATPEEAVPVRRRKSVTDVRVGPLTITNPDPRFVYKFVKDSSESGTRIFDMRRRDWEFVSDKDKLNIPEDYAYTSPKEGSIYRRPADRDGTAWLYLMKIRKEWYEEDQQKKSDRIDKTEKGLFTVDTQDGQYGRVGYEKPGR